MLTMHYVYLLQYRNEEKYYIGCTGDLNNRVDEHQDGSGCATTARVKDPGKWQLVYYEAYGAKSDATRREQKLKDYGAARGHLYNRTRDSIDT